MSLVIEPINLPVILCRPKCRFSEVNCNNVRLDPSHWFDAAPLITAGVLLAILAGFVEQYLPKQAWSRAMARFSYLAPVTQGVVLGIALLVINTTGPSGVAPFIYFRF